MRKVFGFILWVFLLVYAGLDRLATLYTLPGDLQSFWGAHMSGLSPIAHTLLVIVTIGVLYLFWPLITRVFHLGTALSAGTENPHDTTDMHNAISDLITETTRLALSGANQDLDDWANRRDLLMDLAGRVHKNPKVRSLASDLVNRTGIVLDMSRNRENWRPTMAEAKEFERELRQEIDS